MLDRYGDEVPSPQERAEAIRACNLCNDNGYRGGVVCDHIDRQEAARRGMAMIRARMGWIS